VFGLCESLAAYIYFSCFETATVFRTIFLAPHVSLFSFESCRTNETKQLAAVVSHPQFRANLFAAIQRHLAFSIPAPIPEPTVKAPAKAGSKKEKKK